MFKKIAFGLLMAMFTASAFAGNANAPAPVNVVVQNEALGSGFPGSGPGTVQAYPMPGGVYWVPQYLPGNPTAATIWPRVINVPCIKEKNGTLFCRGYHWSPRMGSAYFLFIRPIVVKKPAPVKVKVILQQPKPLPALPPAKKING